MVLQANGDFTRRLMTRMQVCIALFLYTASPVCRFCQDCDPGASKDHIMVCKCNLCGPKMARHSKGLVL